MNHWVWEDDTDESLCGEDMSNHGWTDNAVDCTKCKEVDELISAAEKIYEMYPTNALALAFANREM